MTRTFLPTIVAALAGLTISAGVTVPAAAQREGTPSELAKAIAGQSRIRVRLASGSILELRGAAVEGSTLVGQTAGIDAGVRYQIEELQHVWRRGSGAGMGFTVGAALGVVGGAAAGIGLANACFGLSCSTASSGDELRAAAVGGVLGGVVVGAMGALVGSSFGRWKTAYKPRGQRLSPVVTTQALGVRLSF
jgi:hypothetical protein